MINLFWRGLKGTPADAGGHERSEQGMTKDADQAVPSN
jgi:hypothetical protein